MAGRCAPSSTSGSSRSNATCSPPARSTRRAALLRATDELAERRLAEISRRAPPSRRRTGYRRVLAGGDMTVAERLLAWLGAQPHVASAVKRAAALKGDLDHDGALAFLSGLCIVLRDAGYAGVVVVLDEVET